MSQALPFSLVQNASSATGSSVQNAQNSNSNTSAAARQPAQQMAFKANAQLPGTDMSALLQNISPEQLAAIGHLFQTGQLQPPPQPPPAAAPPSSNAAVPFTQPAAAAAADDMDIDKEEGEWDEGEVEAPKERDFLRPPPSGPRKRSASPGNDRSRYGREARSGRNLSSPKQQKKNGIGSRDHLGNAKGDPVLSGQQVARREATRDAAKRFVTAAYRAGFDFEDFAREVGDATYLRSIFQELDLETGASHRGTERRSQANSSATTGNSLAALQINGVGAHHTPASKPPVVPPAKSPASVIKRPTPAKPAGTADRQAYLAKLQAARNKSANIPASNAAANPATPVVSPPALQTDGVPSSAVRPPNPAPTSATPPVVQQPRRVNVNNDLVRQRLEALRRDNAQRELARAAAASDAAIADPQPSSTTAAHGDPTCAREPLLSAQTTRPSTPQSDRIPAYLPTPSLDTNVSMPTSSSAPFPGLPGLFMTGSPFQARSGQVFPGLGAPPAQPQLQTAASLDAAQEPAVRHQEIAARTSARQIVQDQPTSYASTPVSGQPSGYRPFRSGHSSGDDKVVIEASDDEESELSDGKDEDVERMPPSGLVNSSRGPGTLSNFPAPANLLRQPNASNTGTPGNTTPGWQADTLSMDAKIAKLKYDLAVKIREKQKARTNVSSAPAPHATPVDSSQPASRAEAATAIAPETSTGNEQAGRPPNDSSNATLVEQLGSHPVDNSVDDQRRAEEIEDMEAEVAKLERQTVFSQQQSAAARANGVPNGGGSTETVAPTASGDAASTSSSDDAMDVSSDDDDNDDDDDDDDDTHVPNHEENNNAADDEDEDEDMYDPAELENLDTHADNGQTSQGVADASTVTPTDSQVVSDGDYTNVFLNNESTVVSPSQNAQRQDGAPQHDGDISSDSSSTSSSESEDEYEPESTQQNVAMNDPSFQTPATTAAQPIALPGLIAPDATETSISRSGPKNSEGDLAPELQPSAAEDLPTVSKPDIQLRTFFTPYESPLTVFKDYRYHPEFSQTVSGGFKSLTYSNKLNPDLVLCPRETAEGECHDQGCEYQHFRGMAVNDNELLKELGTRNIPNKTPEDDKRWKEGLTKVVQSLRASNQGKDVNAIAARIAQFRREFVGRPDSVLSLDRA